jgi:hypothetical protein
MTGQAKTGLALLFVLPTTIVAKAQFKPLDLQLLDSVVPWLWKPHWIQIPILLLGLTLTTTLLVQLRLLLASPLPASWATLLGYESA